MTKQVKSHISVTGQNVNGVLHDLMSWLDIIANTLAPNRSNAKFVKEVSLVLIIWLFIWKDIYQNSISNTKRDRIQKTFHQIFFRIRRALYSVHYSVPDFALNLFRICSEFVLKKSLGIVLLYDSKQLKIICEYVK
jgi:hypothetical protein